MICTTIGELRKLAAVIPPYKPYGHQAEANERFKQTGSIVLAHPVGSGKTFTAVYMAEDARKRGDVKRILVVTPTALRDNFAIEGVKKFSDSNVQVFGSKTEAAVSKDRVTLHTADPSADYSVVGYELFRMNPEAYIEKINPDMLILDEYHRAKDEDSLTFKAIERIRPFVKKFIGMTASIVSNDPSDVVPFVDLATVGSHPFSDRKWFKNRYEYTRGVEEGFFGGQKKRIGLRRTKELREMLNDVVHYVSSEQVAKDKPERKVVEVSVEMSPLQRRYYHYSLDKLNPELKDRIMRGLPPRNGSEARSMFRMLMDARRAANSIHPFHRFITPAEGAKLSPKVTKLLDDAEAHIKSTPDARIMMYSELIDGGLDVLAAGLQDRGIPFRVFAGKGREVGGQKVTDKSRRAAKDALISGETKVMLVSPSGAEGLNLHNATMLQSLDAHFNPERIHQVEGRVWRSKGQAHRLPEDRVVQVRRYRSVIPPHLNFIDRFFGNDTHERTVDEWIYQTAAAKDRLNAVLRMSMSGQQELADDPTWVFTPYRDLRMPPAHKILKERTKKLRQEQSETISGRPLYREEELKTPAPAQQSAERPAEQSVERPAKQPAEQPVEQPAKERSDGVRVYNTAGRYQYAYKIHRQDGGWEYFYPKSRQTVPVP